ncbi:acyl-CoA thioesterase II [Arenicella sp. 4NH20-0111]|uniref:acyl-CoA thioesterase n=1 Tax=Arenicella sp. 4NH20-0111 TaxID=3127648 RepID=UPI0031052A84
MSKSSSPLLDFLNCETLDLNLYRGQSRDFKTGQVYGGQVLGQAIKAAYNTLPEDRFIHSAHAYFLLRGDVDAPIIYEVDRSLDGGSFSSRRVVAIQHGRQIFHLSASFQKPEEGLDFYRKWVPPVDALHEALEQTVPLDHNFQNEYFDVHYLPSEKVTREDCVQYWMKAKHPLPDDLACHHSVLAYISDMGLLQATLIPHKLDEPDLQKRHEKVLLATIDHAIWFHRPFRADDWLFYECRVQSTGNGRGLAHGRIHDQSGALVASTSQEGLLRLRRLK